MYSLRHSITVHVIRVAELQPDLTRGTFSESKPNVFDNGYCGQKGSTLPYGLPADNAFRPINQAYMIQSPPSYQLTGPNCRGITSLTVLYIEFF